MSNLNQLTTRVPREMVRKLNLYYVDRLPTNINFNKFEDILDKYDCDVIESILEKQNMEDIFDVFIYTEKNYNVKHIYIENVYDVSYAHALVLLNKFPEAEISMFMTENSKDSQTPSIFYTHYDILVVEDMRTNQPSTSKKRKFERNLEINTKDLLEEFRNELLRIENLESRGFDL